MKIAIIGGGISGLATAFFIQQTRPDWELHVFESHSELGGTMHTEEKDGFFFEAGGNGFLTNKPETLELVAAAGANELLLPSSDAARIRYIFNDRLHRLPESPPAFLKSDLLSTPQKLRVLAELLIPPKKSTDDETVERFGLRRLGRGFTDTLLDAMTAGIYASTPSQLSMNAAFPLVVKLEREHGGLFKGMLKKRKRGAGPGGVLTSFKGGVGTFIRHLASTVEAHYYLNVSVNKLRAGNGRYTVETADGEDLVVDRVVVATPAHAAAGILGQLDPDISGLLATIEYSPVAVVGFGYDQLDHPLDGFGLLTTTNSGKQVLGILWDSAIFPDRAPEGKKAIRVMIGGQRNPELATRNDEELVDIALAGVKDIMGSRATPSTVFCKCWRRGIPNYTVGHLDKVDRIFRKVRTWPGLYLTSNAYYGIGMNDCVANGKATARAITETPD